MPRYRTTLRAAMFGGMPTDIIWHYVEWPSDYWGPIDTPAGKNPGGIPRSRHRYGVVETNRELTPAELEHFDIIPA